MDIDVLAKWRLGVGSGGKLVSDEILDGLVATIRAHYDEPDPQPLLLSFFGQKHKDQLTQVKLVFGSLKAAIKAAGEDRLKFVDLTAGQEAVAPTDVAVDVGQKLERETAAQRQAAVSFDNLPYALRIAFVARIEAGQTIAVELIRPFRFSKVTTPDLLRPTQRLLADEYRRPGLALRSASVQDREKLWHLFLAWCENIEVDPAQFQQGEATTALGRLISAQPAEIVNRLIIPADIAAILLKHA